LSHCQIILAICLLLIPIFGKSHFEKNRLSIEIHRFTGKILEGNFCLLDNIAKFKKQQVALIIEEDIITAQLIRDATRGAMV